MKNVSMNRQSPVSIVRVLLLAFSILGILFSSPFFMGCGGDEDEEVPEVSISPNPLEAGEEGVSPVAEVPVADDKEEVPGEGVSPMVEVPPVVEVPAVDDGSCKVGDILAPGESCIDPGTGDTFTVLADGRGQYLFITAGTGITLRGSINGIRRNFVATKRGDGSWEIESVTPREDGGGNPDNPDVQCEIPPLNEDWGGEPVLFFGGRVGTGGILLSDGKFVVFIYKDPADPPPVNVYGGPVQTATKALVHFGGFDVLNKNGEEVPDGEVTANEVSDAIVGVIELVENRRILTIKIPEQRGETIEGGNTLFMWADIIGPCTLDENEVPPALSAELMEYAKDLLDIMR